MSMDAARELRYRVRHETVYAYARKVAHSHQALYLTPRSFDRQRCLSHSIEIDPYPAVRSEHLDAFGNTSTRFELDRPHDRLDVAAHMDIAIKPAESPPAAEGETWEHVRDQLCYMARPRQAQWLEAMRFRSESPFVRIKRAFGEFARPCFVPGTSVLTVAEALMAKIHADFTYAPGETQIATPLLEVLQTRRGVCQDYAHLMLACLRTSGLAARYVSGYLRTRSGEVPGEAAAADDAAAGSEAQVGREVAVAGEVAAGSEAAAGDAAGHEAPGQSDAAATRLVGADASHAWVAVFAPPFGWIEFDPTNNVRVATEHVALAWGRDFGDVSPLHGVILGGGQHVLTVRVEVVQLSS